MLTPGQYRRIERAAGGPHAPDRAFIRALRRILSRDSRHHHARNARRSIYRQIAQLRDASRRNKENA